MIDYTKIKLVILDVDGTLTDGSVYYDSNGNEIKQFNIKDGLGIKVALKAGIKIAILTGRKSSMVEKRAKELEITYLREGVQQKYPTMIELLKEAKVNLDEVCYIGDDCNDLQCMKAVGVKMCPADAAKEIIAICDYVAESRGGHGAVRECLEHLLRETEEWDKYCTKLYETEEIRK